MKQKLLDQVNKSILGIIPGFMWSSKAKSTSRAVECTQTLFIGDTCKTVTGLAPSALKTKANLLKSLTIPEDQHKLETAFQELLLNKKADCRHRIIDARTGEIRHVESRMVATASLSKNIIAKDTIAKTGAIDRVDGVTLDITDIAELEEQVKILQLNLIQMTTMQRKAQDKATQDEVLKFSEINLPAIIEDCLARLRPFFESKSIKLKASTVDPNLRIKGYKRQLEEVFICVLLNAIDAVEKVKNGTVHVKIERENKNALITVTDTGPGILEEHQSKLFEPFFTTKPIIAATDRIGLSISQLTIQQHGGSITFTSTPNQGTSFFIRIPHCNDFKKETHLDDDVKTHLAGKSLNTVH